MLPTSELYKEAIVAYTRSTEPTIYFGIYDVTAKDDATPSSNVQTQPFSDILATVDNFRTPTAKLGTLEENLFKLDGSFKSLPSSAVQTDFFIGWWSVEQSDINREFEINPTITISFVDLHTSSGIELFFDKTSYCESFEVTWYNGPGIISQQTVIENTNIRHFVDNAVENYNKIVIEIIRTDKPFRFVKITEINFGGEEVFDGDSVIRASISPEEFDPSFATLVYNKLIFTVSNENQKFNMMNPNGVYTLLQKRQQITAEIAVTLENNDIERIPLGVYYLSDWKNATGLTATLEATDAIGLLDRTTYSSSPFWVDEPIENVLNHILNDAGTFPLIVSEDAQTELVNGYIPASSHRSAFANVLMAHRCGVKKGRTGLLEVVRVNYGSIPVKSIDTNLISGDPSIAQKQFITSVSATEYTYSLNPTAEQLHESSFTLNGTETVLITFDSAVENVNVSVTGAGTLSEAINSAVSSKVTVQGFGLLTITITGNKYIESKRVVTSNIDVIPAGEIPQTATIADNKLITKNASLVAQQFLDYCQKRIKQSFNFWCDPALEAGDLISVKTMFGDYGTGIIERQTITFAPSLIAKLEVTG